MKHLRGVEQHSISVGRRGCAGFSDRHRGIGHKPRICAQKAIIMRGGKPYCYYHDPENPKRFGEGKYSCAAQGHKSVMQFGSEK
jgi:hypothetical protein